MLCHVIWWKLTDIPEILAASIIRVVVMDALSPSKIPVHLYETTWCNILEVTLTNNINMIMVLL
jgi:hypothetical protein